MIPYILYVAVITTICFLFYKFLLQKETFYRLNRWVLLGCLTLAFVLPLLPVPREWSWRKQGAVVPSVLAAKAPVLVEKTRVVAEKVPAVVAETPRLTAQVPVVIASTGKAKKHRAVQTKTPHRALAEVASNDRPVVADVQSVIPTVNSRPLQAEQSTISDGVSITQLFSIALHWLFYFYLVGLAFFAAKFLFQLATLLYQSYANPVIRDGRFRIIETDGNRAPCSFGNTIFINPASYDWDTYNQILIHEKTHVSGRHTVDILLAEIAVVLQWFNPIAWLYRREVENNLEFLTDESVLLHKEVERSAYQLSLLRVSAPHLAFSLTNNYNQSLLKRRIVMMNSKRSPRLTVWKYFFLLPIFTVLVCVLNKPLANSLKTRSIAAAGKNAAADTSKPVQPAVKANAAQPASSSLRGSASSPASSSSPSSAPCEPADPAKVVRPYREAVEAYESKVLTLSSGIDAITSVNVNTAFSTSHSSLGATNVRLNTVTIPNANTLTTAQSMISVNTNLDNVNVTIDELTDGAWFVTTNDNKLWFELKAEDEEHSWSNTMKVEKTEINPFPGKGNVTFKLVREAGVITFTGQFDGEQGFGHFHFQPDEAFYKAIQQMGVEEMEDHRKMGFFLADVKKDYVKMIQNNGFPHIAARQLVTFSAMHIDQDFIQYWRGTGLEDINEPRTIISLKSLHIDKGYVEELKAAGYDHLTSRQLFSMKAQHIDGQYARQMGRGKDNQPIPVEQLVSYKAMKIDSEYLNSLRKVGYSNLERHEITSLNSMHVTADFIKSFQDIGYKDLTVREIIQLKSMKITPELLKGFRDIGYNDISPARLSSLKAMGITPEYVAELKKIGFDNIPVSMLTSLKSTGVNAEYIAKMKEKGFVTSDLNKYIRLKRDFE